MNSLNSINGGRLLFCLKMTFLIQKINYSEKGSIQKQKSSSRKPKNYKKTLLKTGKVRKIPLKLAFQETHRNIR